MHNLRYLLDGRFYNQEYARNFAYHHPEEFLAAIELAKILYT